MIFVYFVVVSSPMIIDQAGDIVPCGIAGKVVVALMSSGEFPFIPCQTGDVDTLVNELCSWGRGFPLPKEIHGCSTDVAVATDGTVMHSLALTYILRDLPGNKEFKVVQETLEFTRVLVVAESPFRSETRQIIISELKQRLGCAVHIDVQVTEMIPAEQSGQFRNILSKVYQKA